MHVVASRRAVLNPSGCQVCCVHLFTSHCTFFPPENSVYLEIYRHWSLTFVISAFIVNTKCLFHCVYSEL